MALFMCVYIGWFNSTFGCWVCAIAEMILYTICMCINCQVFFSSLNRWFFSLMRLHTRNYCIRRASHTKIYKLIYSKLQLKCPSSYGFLHSKNNWCTHYTKLVYGHTEIKQSDHVEFQIVYTHTRTHGSYNCWTESMENQQWWCQMVTSKKKWVATKRCCECDSIEMNLVCDHVAECWMMSICHITQTIHPKKYILQMNDIRNLFSCTLLRHSAVAIRRLVFLFIQRQRDVFKLGSFSLAFFSC